MMDGEVTGVRTVGIVGLGLIGGSLALRLVRAGIEVHAWNHTDRPYAAARAAGIRCEPGLRQLAQLRPDLIVLCNPLRAMPQVLEAVGPFVDERATTLSDVGSVKGQVRKQVREAGLAGCYVGAHPMAGNELSGFGAADPGLLDNALWAVDVDSQTDYGRFLAVSSMITNGLGNRMIVLDDRTHDRAAAMISHMPHAVATCLINMLCDDPDRNVAAALAAGSWRDMTRVALTDPDRTRAMIEEDDANVAALLHDLAGRLTRLADDLQRSDGDALADFFFRGQDFRDFKRRVGHSGAGGGSRSAGPGDESRREADMRLDPLTWRDDLLLSARRGENIISFISPRHVRIRTNNAM